MPIYTGQKKTKAINQTSAPHAGEFLKIWLPRTLRAELTNQSSVFTPFNQSDVRAAGLNTRMWKSNQTFFASARETISGRAREFLVENCVKRTLCLL